LFYSEYRYLLDYNSLTNLCLCDRIDFS